MRVEQDLKSVEVLYPGRVLVHGRIDSDFARERQNLEEPFRGRCVGRTDKMETQLREECWLLIETEAGRMKDCPNRLKHRGHTGAHVAYVQQTIVGVKDL